MLYYNMNSFKGSKIQFKKDENNTMKEYYITFRWVLFLEYLALYRVFIFSQEEYSPEDPANPCADYPTEEYESYADCDDHFVRSFLPPGLKPFWTVDNISEATDKFNLDDYESFFDIHGIFRSDCWKLRYIAWVKCVSMRIR